MGNQNFKLRPIPSDRARHKLLLIAVSQKVEALELTAAQVAALSKGLPRVFHQPVLMEAA
jgi:hypothetical protein